MNQNEKLEGFAHEIFKNADALVKKIESRTAKATKEQTEQFAAKAKAEFETRAAYETSRLRTGSNREIARLNAEVRRAAVQHREELLDQVFARAAEKLSAFCESEAYPQRLRACIEGLVERIGADATVFVCARDKAAAKEICGSLPGVREVLVRDDIQIGFASACNAEKTLFLDDTLDSRLRAQRDVFLQMSGLSLEA